MGEFHDQWDAKWIVIRGLLRGHNDTPCGWPTPGQPIGRLEVGRPQGVFFGFSYYKLIILFSNIVPLVVEFTFRPSDLKAELNDQLKVGDEIRAEIILLININ